jgi:hypothetical protein
LKSGHAVTQVDTDDAVIDFAATAQPLSGSTDGLIAALGRSRFIDTADRFGMGVIARQQLLAAVA